VRNGRYSNRSEKLERGRITFAILKIGNSSGPCPAVPNVTPCLKYYCTSLLGSVTLFNATRREIVKQMHAKRYERCTHVQGLPNSSKHDDGHVCVGSRLAADILTGLGEGPAFPSVNGPCRLQWKWLLMRGLGDCITPRRRYPANSFSFS
jgi:hypothetical protein